MSTTSTSKRPSHRAYMVSKSGEKNYWTEIGAAWAHEGGDGMTLRLKLLPLDGSDIVIRVPRERDESQDKGGAQ